MKCGAEVLIHQGNKRYFFAYCAKYRSTPWIVRGLRRWQHWMHRLQQPCFRAHHPLIPIARRQLRSASTCVLPIPAVLPVAAA
jgi:hypothetical protein